MIGNKFFIDISSLDKIELLNFVKYSKSSFLNKNPLIIKTIELFKKNKRHFNNLVSNENLMFKMVFSENENHDKKLLQQHFYACEKLFEDFVVFYISQNKKEEKIRILADFYTEKNIKKKALVNNAKLISIVEKKKVNYKNYFHLFDLNLKKFYILLNDFNYETFQYAEKALSYLDQYYFLEKFNIKQELLTDTIMSNRKYDFILLDEIKKEIENNSEIANKLLFKIHSITLDLYEKKVDKETFFILKELINSNLDKFSENSLKLFLGDVGNYLTILYSKTGDNTLLKEVFENYKLQLEYRTIIKNKSIPDANFSQIIRIALFLKEFEWSTNFIDEFEKYLNNEDLVLLSRAEICYAQKKYDNVIDILSKVDLKTTKLNYELKSIYAKTLYDTKEFDLLENHLNTFEIYLRRQKKMNELIKKNNLNFVLFFKRMVHNLVSKANLKKLIKDIEEDKRVFNRNWLLARLKVLLN